jgi:hypothetical protein
MLLSAKTLEFGEPLPGRCLVACRSEGPVLARPPRFTATMQSLRIGQGGVLETRNLSFVGIVFANKTVLDNVFFNVIYTAACV